MSLRRVKPQARWREGGGHQGSPPGMGMRGDGVPERRATARSSSAWEATRAEEQAAVVQRCWRGYSSCVYNAGKASPDIGG